MEWINEVEESDTQGGDPSTKICVWTLIGGGIVTCSVTDRLCPSLCIFYSNF